MGIQLKRSLTSAIDTSYVLEQGQPAIEMPAATNTATSPFKLKVGDGTTAWSSLPYIHAGSADTATTANTLTTARTFRVNLASTSTASFNGSANVTPGVTGTLPVARGGTGVTTIDALKTALGIGSSSSGDLDNTALARIKMYTYNTADSGLFFNDDNAIIWGGTTTQSWKSKIVSLGVGCNVTTGRNLQRYIAYQIDGDESTSFYPDGETSQSCSLGTSSCKWKVIYATSGAIQTSDKSAKHSIHYLSEGSATTVDENGETVQGTGLEDVIEFINTFEPATFLYNDLDDDSPAKPENRQLGIIADDIENTKLFPYIGGRWSWDARPDQLDDDGNVVRPGREAGSTLGLKPVPLAVAALTACKYLLQRVELLESK